MSLKRPILHFFTCLSFASNLDGKIAVHLRKKVNPYYILIFFFYRCAAPQAEPYLECRAWIQGISVPKAQLFCIFMEIKNEPKFFILVRFQGILSRVRSDEAEVKFKQSIYIQIQQNESIKNQTGSIILKKSMPKNPQRFLVSIFIINNSIKQGIYIIKYGFSTKPSFVFYNLSFMKKN